MNIKDWCRFCDGYVEFTVGRDEKNRVYQVDARGHLEVFRP